MSGKLLQFVRDLSFLQYHPPPPTKLSCLQIDQDTNDLLRSLNMVNLPGVKMVPVSSSLALCLLLNAAVPSHCVTLCLELMQFCQTQLAKEQPVVLLVVCAGPLIIQYIKCEAKNST